MQEYTSCHWIQHGLSFESNHIKMCCLCCHKGGGRIVITDKFDEKKFDWKTFLGIKQKFIDENIKGIIDPRCDGCFNLVKRGWDDNEKYISYIHFNHWTRCNCDCIYCYTNWDKKNFNTKPYYNVFPVIKKLFEEKLFRPGGEITFAGGEPTILKDFDKLILYMLKNGADRITIHSSGIKYSKGIEKGIKEKKVSVCLSADSGDKDMYKKIKRVDKFDIFWKNAKKYAKAQPDDNKKLVETKFILIPEFNATKEQIDKWIDLNIETGIKSIVLDIEDVYCQDLRNKKKQIPEYLVDLCGYIIEKAKEYKLNLVEYNNFRYLIEEYHLV